MAEKKMQCTQFDPKANCIKDVGYMQIKNSTNEKAELYLYGDIVKDEWYKWSDDDTCPQDITDFLKDLNNFDNVDIFINSGGGSVHGGLAIYNQLKRHQGNKTVRVDGIAASIASVIACAGDRIIIPTNAQFMIHKPSICLWANMNADDLRKEADVLDVCQNSIMSIYMDNVKAGIERSTIEDLVNAETWFTGENVTDYFNFEVEEGLEAVACASNYYDKYKNSPNGLRNKSFFNAKNSTKEELPVMDDETRIMLERIKNKSKAWNL